MPGQLAGVVLAIEAVRLQQLPTFTVITSVTEPTGKPLSVAVRLIVWVPWLQGAPVIVIVVVEVAPLVELTVVLQSPPVLTTVDTV